MKIAIIDITGRNASQYNPSLCGAIVKQTDRANVTLCSPTLAVAPHGYHWLRLLSLLPKKMVNSASTGLVKKIMRGIETSLNYLFIAIWAFFKKPEIIHFQWLPFVEYSGIEPFFLRLIHAASHNSKMYLTVHNIYPHGISENRRDDYCERFKALKRFFSGYLVHLEGTKEELSKDFDIDKKYITVAYHGLYQPQNIEKYKDEINITKDEHIRVIMYGYQTPYKGADILVKAIGLLPSAYQDKVRCSIIGRTDSNLYYNFHNEAEKLNIKWIDRFVSDEELNDAIYQSDLILLPYRSISQSGVLLLALAFKKPILTSDLPSFKETLRGYPEDYFFASNRPESLADKLMDFIDSKIDCSLMKKVIVELNGKYSWDETAKSTLAAYGISQLEK